MSTGIGEGGVAPMHIRVERFVSDADTTIGMMLVNNKFFGFTLEDEFRAEKVPRETRIPQGTYLVKLREEGGMIQKYRARYGSWHKGMIHLQSVPGFEYIYIHAGNTDDHTDGCILVGYTAVARPGSGMSIGQSRDAYARLALQVHEAVERGAEVSVTVVDKDDPVGFAMASV